MNHAFSANRQASEEERHAVGIADGPDGPQVLERDRLAAARVVRDRHEHDRNEPITLAQETVKGLDIHVALERMDERRVAAFRDDEVDGLRTRELDVRPSRVEVGVVGDRLPRPADHGEQDLLGGATLVRRDHVL